MYCISIVSVYHEIYRRYEIIEEHFICPDELVLTGALICSSQCWKCRDLLVECGNEYEKLQRLSGRQFRSISIDTTSCLGWVLRRC